MKDQPGQSQAYAGNFARIMVFSTANDKQRKRSSGHFHVFDESRILITTHLSQAAACNGTIITTSADGQNIAPGTLPTF